MHELRLLTSALVAITAMLLTALPAEASATSLAPVSPSGRILSSSPVPLAKPAAVPASGPLATEIYWSRWSTSLVYGTEPVLEGQVVTIDGALPRAEVRLLARSAGSSRWSRVASSLTSTDTGLFAFNRHVPAATTDYRVVFAGNLVYAGAEGGKRVAVARRIRDSLTQRADGRFAFSGSVSPSYAGKKVVIHRKECSSCRWRTVSSTQTGSTSRWRSVLSGPTRRGSWYFRAMVPGDIAFTTSYGDHIWRITRR